MASVTCVWAAPSVASVAVSEEIPWLISDDAAVMTVCCVPELSDEPPNSASIA